MELEKIIKEKCTLKDFETLAILRTLTSSEYLFSTANGFILGKPYFEENTLVSSFLMLTEVVMLTNNKNINFSNSIFYLSIDQIIAFSPIERDSFLHQLQADL
ncbi:hypothetical protein SDC9_89647 [bioreactor metagenome]|uniref:Uncharacterized protein n=1 Tax=bioreactor metagenome TaxID=1076179 RepID=A0A644ZQ11_9ZZZZ